MNLCYNRAMKKALFFIILLSPFLASASEKIDNFDVTVRINQDASINVSERINYDFDDLEKHGIFRDVTVNYNARGGNYNLRVSNISVTDENGTGYNFETSTEGKNLRIKIGDADKLVTGKKTYAIDYKIKRAINFFDSQDELYWNATGDQWPVPIEKSSAKVILPVEAPKEKLQTACFYGSYGSATQCEASLESEGGKSVFVYKNPTALDPGQGLTFVSGFPKGIVEKPGTFQNLLDIVNDNWILFLPFITLVVLFYLWYTRGRDPKGRGTIIAEYGAPDNLTPVEVGTIIDGEVDKVDISAEIIDLAVKGYIKITKIKKEGIVFDSDDYLLEKLKSEDDLSNGFQKKLIASLFSGDLTEISKIKIASESDKAVVRGLIEGQSVRLSELKNKFYIQLKDIKNQIYSAVTDKGYFVDNPKDVSNLYTGIGATILIGSFVFSEFFGGLAVFGLIISGVIILIFGFIMPARTKKGVLAKEKIIGLKEYLSVAEKDRIKFHNAPEKNPERFEKLLPFAMVLGVEEEWAKQFEGIYKNPPSWYEDSSGGSFNSLLFVHSLNNFSSMANANLSSSPSSASGGGSGFSGGGSGGGFGGGGGGSW